MLDSCIYTLRVAFVIPRPSVLKRLYIKTSEHCKLRVSAPLMAKTDEYRKALKRIAKINTDVFMFLFESVTETGCYRVSGMC